MIFVLLLELNLTISILCKVHNRPSLCINFFTCHTDESLKEFQDFQSGFENTNISYYKGSLDKERLETVFSQV